MIYLVVMLIKLLEQKASWNVELKKLRSLIASIRNQEFEPKPSPLCHWCEYCPTNPYQPEEAVGKVYCPYHSLWTKAKASFAKAAEWQGLENHGIVVENYIKKILKSSCIIY